MTLDRLPPQPPPPSLDTSEDEAAVSYAEWQARLAMVKRWVGARKRALSRPCPRKFPCFTQGMTTAAYVRLYYEYNFRERPELYLTVPLGAAPFYTGEPIEIEVDE